ncbi:hypothetical protein BBP40_001690 [Aspergillus hancockii]|nr:hypothetical protein BBP40_001690 [Aspergillus hancockii]
MNPLRRVPGPFYTALTRCPLKFASFTGNRIYFIHELHRKYGPVVRIAPDEVDVSSLAGFGEIHRIGSPFLKSEWYDQFVTDKKRTIFLMRDPKEHATRRKLFARPFSKSELRRIWEPVVKEKVQLAVSQIRNDLKVNEISDLLKWWTFLATDVGGHLMFGESFDMLRFGKEYLLRYAQRAVTIGRAASKASRNIFSSILYESEKGNSAITDEDVTVEAGALILAGADTTAVTLTYLIWAVLSQPKLQRELEKEVSTLGADFTDASLEELPLLNAVIMETLRLYGAAPGALPRTTPEGGAIFSGYFVPEGVTTSAAEKAKKAFVPFGGGARICLGIHLAWMELRLATAEFFRECRSVRLAPSATWENMKPLNYILISPSGRRCEIVAK